MKYGAGEGSWDNKEVNMKQVNKLYKSRRWELKREWILRRDEYTCQYSKRFGKRIDADTVHHIYPADLYPEYKYCDWNLTSLSNSNHNKMHDRVTNKLTEEGLCLMRRTKIPNDCK